MSDINLQITIKEESNHLFKRCIRKLLESTFILRDKDYRLYQFVSRESNRHDISEYLRMIGFDVIVEEKTGVCMLVASEEDVDTVGLKRANVVTFSTLQYHLLLVLWEVYLENIGYSEGNFVTKGDLIDKIYYDNPSLTYRHFGDIDAGGLYIHEHLCRATGISFQMHLMSRAELEDTRFQSCLRPLSDNDHLHLESLEKQEIYQNLAGYMLEHGVKLEQEIISYYEY